MLSHRRGFSSNFLFVALFLGKGHLSKVGRKPSVVDENRRATYNISTQPVIRSESIFTTFDGEIKQFVAVCNKESVFLFPQ